MAGKTSVERINIFFTEYSLIGILTLNFHQILKVPGALYASLHDVSTSKQHCWCGVLGVMCNDIQGVQF